jgi:hypothetical protein
MNKAYHKFLKTFDPKDEEARRNAFKPIMDFCASQNLSRGADDPTMRSAISRIRSATKQFSTLVSCLLCSLS